MDIISFLIGFGICVAFYEWIRIPFHPAISYSHTALEKAKTLRKMVKEELFHLENLHNKLEAFHFSPEAIDDALDQLSKEYRNDRKTVNRPIEEATQG